MEDCTVRDASASSEGRVIIFNFNILRFNSVLNDALAQLHGKSTSPFAEKPHYESPPVTRPLRHVRPLSVRALSLDRNVATPATDGR